jgi:hypothetical protein
MRPVGTETAVDIDEPRNELRFHLLASRNHAFIEN